MGLSNQQLPLPDAPHQFIHWLMDTLGSWPVLGIVLVGVLTVFRKPLRNKLKEWFR